jgi:hypothetical protein
MRRSSRSPARPSCTAPCGGRIRGTRPFEAFGTETNAWLALQPDRELREGDVVAEYQRALAAGDVDAVVAALEPDGYRPTRASRPTSRVGARSLL